MEPFCFLNIYVAVLSGIYLFLISKSHWYECWYLLDITVLLARVCVFQCRSIDESCFSLTVVETLLLLEFTRRGVGLYIIQHLDKAQSIKLLIITSQDLTNTHAGLFHTEMLLRLAVTPNSTFIHVKSWAKTVFYIFWKKKKVSNVYLCKSCHGVRVFGWLLFSF